MAYAKRYGAGFVDKPTLTTPIDSTFLNAVEAALLALFDANPASAGMVPVWTPAGTHYVPQLLTNASIDPAAAIAKSKLANLAIADADVAGGAAISRSKLNFGAGLVPDSDFALLGNYANAIASAATLPNVAGRFKIYTVTGTTTITDFTAGGVPGDLLVLTASNQAAGVCVVFSHAGKIKLRDAQNFGLYAGESLVFVWDGSNWQEIARNTKAVIGFASKTANVATAAAAGFANGADIFANITLTSDGVTPLRLDLQVPNTNNGGGTDGTIFAINLDGAESLDYTNTNAYLNGLPYTGALRITPTNASHTLNVRIYSNGAWVSTAVCSATSPCQLRISRDI